VYKAVEGYSPALRGTLGLCQTMSKNQREERDGAKGRDEGQRRGVANESSKASGQEASDTRAFDTSASASSPRAAPRAAVKDRARSKAVAGRVTEDGTFEAWRGRSVGGGGWGKGPGRGEGRERPKTSMSVLSSGSVRDRLCARTQITADRGVGNGRGRVQIVRGGAAAEEGDAADDVGAGVTRGLARSTSAMSYARGTARAASAMSQVVTAAAAKGGGGTAAAAAAEGGGDGRGGGGGGGGDAGGKGEWGGGKMRERKSKALVDELGAECKV
jgi:hypothetical protein